MSFEFLRHATWGGVYPIAFLSAAISAFILTFLVRYYSKSIDFLDIPIQRSSHSIPVPLGGGAAICAAFTIGVHFGVFEAGIREHALYVIVFGGLIALTMGLVDDFRGGIPAIYKLVFLLVMTLACWWVDDRLILKIFPWTWANVFLTLLWIAGVCSALNAFDNMNGLSVGFTAVASLAYFVVAVQTQSEVGFAGELNRFWGLVSIALCGACLGFLPHNFPRAKIFIGDGGSFFLGFCLAVLGVMGEWSNHSVSRATIPLLILALPIFDLVFVVYTRHRSGVTRTWIEAVRHCARDHLSHRLVFLGLSPVQAVLVLHAVAIFMALSAIIMRADENPSLTYMHLLQAGMVLLILGVLIKVGSRKGMT
ncbi:MAG: undecaprenyl/decaprenyl-phosphate alpha-N-acetylglucosaminyl 1-phosphate transferase [Candidatus Omnitrophica bacterium]|nr:undecaprenyl/decaprenyl-phosphate alpha-N-acetylglucosaminyl 1-phosphate transferase [Candidatus Omnitrophota bacterium]